LLGEWAMARIILLLSLISNNSWADPYKDATNKAAQAFYQYQHWDEDVSKFLQHYENKFTPEEKIIGGWIGFGIRCAIDRKLEFTYRFP